METDLQRPVQPSVTQEPRAERQRAFVLILVVLVFVFSSFITLLMRHQPHKLAMLGMAWGLIFFWIIGCGLAMWHWRTLACQLAAKLAWPWPIKFVIGCILLAMLEEAVTTTMTNCAPLFGVKVGQAYITASTNYFDVILRHSVVIFVPMFVGWAVVLKFWRFSPFEVFLLWGICGTLLEFRYSGFQGMPNFPFWILVYGLMVWLPAHLPNPLRKAKLPTWWAYPLAVILPPLFLPLDLVLAPWLWLGGKHPDIHFPPITG